MTIPGAIAERLAAVRRGLRISGYTGSLLQEGYRFADYSGPGTEGTVRTIDFAAFGQEPLTTKTACLGVVIGDHAAEELTRYRALGAPQLLTVSDTSVDRWKVLAQGKPRWLESLPSDRIAESIAEKTDEWGPEAVLRAKAIPFGTTVTQLDFFDLELVPSIERQIRRKLNDLLSRARDDTQAAYRRAHGVEPDPHQLFRLIFRLLAAKLLADRRHEGHDWLAGTPAVIIERVEQFYFPGATERIPLALADPAAQATAWERISRGFHLENVSLDTLAWIWENAFVTLDIRARLGIHGTPPELAEYLVRRLPFEDVPLGQLRVFEPCTGQGAFLVAALGRIRELLMAEQPTLTSAERHDRFVGMLTGMELDGFAIEIARLSLMLADYPHPGGWGLYQGDVFSDARVTNLMRNSAAVLCNPPFGKWGLEERQARSTDGEYDKAAAILKMVLANPPLLLGFVLPHGFRNGKAYRDARRTMAQTYSTIEVTELPDSVFPSSEAESVLVTAHGRATGATTTLQARTVRPGDLERFLRTGEASSDRQAHLTPLDAEHGLWVYELDRVWSALADHPRLSSIAVPRRGIAYLQNLRKHRDALVSKRPRQGSRPGVQEVSDDFEPFFLGELDYLNVDPKEMRRQAHHHPWHLPKVLVNRHRRQRGVWKLTAVPDYSGLIASENFHGVWPIADVPAEVIAAILNGHVANAFVAGREESRSSGRGSISDIPIPKLSQETIRQLTDLVSVYRVERAEHQVDPLRQRAARCQELLREIDSIMLEAYELSPEAKRDLLDYFADTPRPGLTALSRATNQVDMPMLPFFRDEIETETAMAPSLSVEDADAALEADLARLREQLRSERPDLFDASGEFRADQVQQALERRVAQKEAQIRAERIALTKRRIRRSPDAT